jgi:hypothetical protein
MQFRRSTRSLDVNEDPPTKAMFGYARCPVGGTIYTSETVVSALPLSAVLASRLAWRRQGSRLMEEFTMKLKRFAAGAAAAGVLGFASIGIGAGQANADDWCWWGWCDVPPPGHFVPSPGHIGQWTGIPPGHWDKPWKWWK